MELGNSPVLTIPFNMYWNCAFWVTKSGLDYIFTVCFYSTLNFFPYFLRPLRNKIVVQFPLTCSWHLCFEGSFLFCGFYLSLCWDHFTFFSSTISLWILPACALFSSISLASLNLPSMFKLPQKSHCQQFLWEYGNALFWIPELVYESSRFSLSPLFFLFFSKFSFFYMIVLSQSFVIFEWDQLFIEEQGK